jgi:hypothetical protein
MKPALFIAILVMLAMACSQVREAPKSLAAVTLSSNDSTQYEIYISDLQFDQWYGINYSDSKDHSLDYYHSKNLVAVSNWNAYFRSGKYTDVIDCQINYEPQIDYGIEVNRRLFWYFKYVQENTNISLYW